MGNEKRKLSICTRSNVRKRTKTSISKEKNELNNASPSCSEDKDFLTTKIKDSKDDRKSKREKMESTYNISSFPFISSSVPNFVKCFTQYQWGSSKLSVLQQIAEQLYLKDLKSFKVVFEHQTSDLRITAMTWHPTNPFLFVSGGRSGNLLLHKFQPNFKCELNCFEGIGPGGTVESVKFFTKNNVVEVLTASSDATVSRYNFETKTRVSLIEFDSPQKIWFCSLDVNEDRKGIFAGNSTGGMAIYHMDNGKYDLCKLHTKRIRHIEFSARDPNVMVTSSVDRSVKLWDVRKISNAKSFIKCLPHDRAVASAKFSLADGCRLLTTDMHDQVRVYKAPNWDLEHKIIHPHPHLQHLTAIRASWHPKVDIFVVARYPYFGVGNYENLRCLDIFSSTTGQLCQELHNPNCTLIPSLTQFNCDGSVLASSYGRKIVMWKSGVFENTINNEQTKKNEFVRLESCRCGKKINESF